MHYLHISLIMLLSSVLHAETLKIPVGSQGDNIDKPSLGYTMSDVKNRYGEPEKVSSPVGEPPITRWDYPEFTVYFEYKSVLHSVSKHQPKADSINQ